MSEPDEHTAPRTPPHAQAQRLLLRELVGLRRDLTHFAACQIALLILVVALLAGMVFQAR
jgi:hypothetical protein